MQSLEQCSINHDSQLTELGTPILHLILTLSCPPASQHVLLRWDDSYTCWTNQSQGKSNEMKVKFTGDHGQHSWQCCASHRILNSPYCSLLHKALQLNNYLSVELYTLYTLDVHRPLTVASWPCWSTPYPMLTASSLLKPLGVLSFAP